MNILITGGGMRNKGAQSMTYILVDELRRRFPSDKIILMLPDEPDLQELEPYTFSAKCAKVKSLYYHIGGLKKAMAIVKKVDKDDAGNLAEIFSNSRMLVDISGYSLSSKWGTYIVRFYLSMIECARRFNVPVYIMPQSFGPFNYSFPKSVYMMSWIKRTMEYPRVIFAREKEGYETLKTDFALENVRLSHDMVIVSPDSSLKAVFKEDPPMKNFEIPSGSVGILPNVRLLDVCKTDDLIAVYKTIVAQLLELGKRVYILHHSNEDQDFANQIYSHFKGEGNVIRFFEDLACYEYETLASKFDFLIASRYHSIVHAYRKGIPCIAIGWAIKYFELLQSFDQQQYAFDVSNEIDCDALKAAIAHLAKNRDEESHKIVAALAEIRKENIFSVFDEGL